MGMTLNLGATGRDEPSVDAAAGGSSRHRGPLAGTTVLDLASVGPGARCTRLLADYGAEVVKVVPAGSGRGARTEPPYFAYSANRAMSRVRIDLKAEGGREAFMTLAARSDVVVESFRPGVVERLGIAYDDVRAKNPSVVYCSTTGYGQAGRRAGWAGHDVDYLAVGGYLAASGRRADGGPPLPGATVADAAAGGMQAALAVTTALVHRAATGEGAFLDVSVADGVVWLMSLPVDEHLATGSEPGPGHDIVSGRYACYDTYETADGRWLAVGAIEPKFFASLCRMLGCEQWIDHQLDDGVQEAVRLDFRAAFATRSRDDWVSELGPADCCVAPVLSVAEVADDPDLAERKAVVDAVHPVHGRMRQIGHVLAGMVPLEAPVLLPDPSATDTDRLLGEAGADPATLERWRARGVIS